MIMSCISITRIYQLPKVIYEAVRRKNKEKYQTKY